MINLKPQAGSFRLGLVGGRLQGIEAAYLARAAGYQVTVVDRNPQAPALSLAQQAYVFDIQKEPERFRKVLSGVDAILPTTEERETLDFLAVICQKAGVPFLHDPAAYAISSSKIRSNHFFTRYGIPTPRKWPDCRFPILVKPSGGSGSHGVRVVTDPEALEEALHEVSEKYGKTVIEAFHQGPSLSLEVIARQGESISYVVTELEFDERLDCKRVYAPSRLSQDVNRRFETICLDIARHLKLNGLTDVENIVDSQTGEIVILEIDARFPSQTPVAVYHASGINLLEEWVKVYVQGQPLQKPVAQSGCASLEHVSVSGSRMEVIGETCLIPWGRLRVWPDGSFFGATLALTDYEKGKTAFKATLIFESDDWRTLAEKRQSCLERIASALKLKDFIDPTFQLA